MWVRHADNLDSDVHVISLALIYLDQNAGMACAEVRLRCSWLTLVLINFDQNVGMICAKV